MNNWKPILAYLIENQEKAFTINQIAKALDINYRIAHTEIQALKKEGLVQVSKAGNSSQCRFSGKFNEKIFAVETGRRNKLFQNKNFKVIHSRLKPINEQFILLLFGSYVKGKQTKHSDIDLLLIANNPKGVENKLNLLPYDIHWTHINYSDFIHMLKSKEGTVVSEAVQKNIIFFGVEDYYRLLENAR